MVTVTSEILLVDVQVVVPVEFPKFTVNDVEVLVAEVRRNLVDVLLLFQKLDNSQQIWPTKFRQSDFSAPGTVHAIENSCNDLKNTTRLI